MNIFRKYFTFDIGGQKRPLRFGTNATALYCELRDCTLADFTSDFDPIRLQNNEVKGSEFRDYIYCGLKDGERYEKKSNLDYVIESFDRDDVGDWLDEMSEEEITAFNNAFVKMLLPVNGEQEQVEDKKKA